MTLIKRITERLRQKYFPTDFDRTVRTWWRDGGDEKFRFDYPLDEHSLVIDCGGYRGQWASDLFSRFCCRIVIFEPVEAFAERIQRRFAKNTRIEVCHFGLGGNSRTETIRICEDGSSIFGKTGDQQEIRIIDVRDWLSGPSMNGRTIQLMKINIEGGEYELLERLIELGLVQNIENIQVQFHDFFESAAPRMELIQRDLTKTHHVTYQYRFVWENWKRNAPLRS